MEERGWVVRARGEPDRRVTLARLTEEGDSFVREVSIGHLALIRAMVFETLGDDEAGRVAEGLDRVGRSDPRGGA
jgi:DNA-binding MarR family transcriptional regulator